MTFPLDFIKFKKILSNNEIEIFREKARQYTNLLQQLKPNSNN